jgi:hypothetical protein
MMPATRFTITSVAVLFAAGLAAAAPLPSEDGALRYKFKEGMKVKYTYEEKNAGDFIVAGTATKTETRAVYDLTWQVTRVGKDGTASITQVVDRVRMDTTAGGTRISYDSSVPNGAADELTKVLAEAFGVLVGAETTLTIDARGRIEGVKHSEKLARDIAGLSPGATGAAQAFSEPGVRRMFGQCLPVLPEKAPATGQTWESKLEAKLAGFGNFTMDNKHTYEGSATLAGRKVEKVVTKPTLGLTADPGMGTVKLLDQDAKCTSYIERASGRLIETTCAQKFDMEMTMGGQTITLKMKIDTTLKLVNEK